MKKFTTRSFFKIKKKNLLFFMLIFFLLVLSCLSLLRYYDKKDSKGLENLSSEKIYEKEKLDEDIGDIKNNEWNINLGTGSQIVVKTKESLDGFETRAFFNGNSLQCISHLPAGRSLDLIANFIKIIREDKNTKYFWKKMSTLKYKKNILKNSLLKIDLIFFEQNKNYLYGGFIKNIKENSFDLNSFLVSTVYSMTKNYADIVNKTKFSKEKNIINLYGALGNNIPIIKPLLKELTGYKVNIKKFNIDPTLENMKNLYKNN